MREEGGGGEEEKEEIYRVSNKNSNLSIGNPPKKVLFNAVFWNFDVVDRSLSRSVLTY